MEEATAFSKSLDGRSVVLMQTCLRQNLSPSVVPQAVSSSVSSSEPSSVLTVDAEDGEPASYVPGAKLGVMRWMILALNRGWLTQVDLSQRGLQASDTRIIELVLLKNPSLSVLKLGYNNLCDQGTSNVASAIHGHTGLSVLDLGFNNVGDAGTVSLASNAVSKNLNLRTLYLSGNSVGEHGASALAEAIREGCGLRCLHLTANKIGVNGVKALTRAITIREEIIHSSIQRRGDIAEAETQSEATERRKVHNGTIDSFRLEELYLGGTNMGPQGCLSISNMLLTNFSLRVLSLSSNDIEDRDLSLFSQSISRNKQVPLEVLELSFNHITCVGVESLMNAVWGSTTLRELRLDNNSIKDRGAQLVAVVLTSVKLEIVDLGFNAITTIGIKTLMKSLAENDSLRSLTLSGNSLDTTASKAVSYALAYNASLHNLHVDHCTVGYAAQRHITAGIASNSQSALDTVTGFRIGAIAVTLGLPPALENWTNDQVLNFFRLMWERWRHENNNKQTPFFWGSGCGNSSTNNLHRSIHRYNTIRVSRSANDVHNNVSPSTEARQRVGPSDPATVVAVAKCAYSEMGNVGLEAITPQRKMSFESPLAPSDTIMLERTPSGQIRIPPSESEYTDNNPNHNPLNGEKKPQTPSSKNDAQHPCVANHCVAGQNCEKLGRNAQMTTWLNDNIEMLQHLAQQPFCSADLWKLHQHFFSPVVACSSPNGMSRDFDGNESKCTSNSPPPQLPDIPCIASSGLERKVSYRFLSDAVSTQSTPSEKINRGSRRRNGTQSIQPAPKRAKKARIAYYPRVREKLETLRSKSSQQESLILMRQLKYTESAMIKCINIYSENISSSDQVSTSDAETILLDMI